MELVWIVWTLFFMGVAIERLIVPNVQKDLFDWWIGGSALILCLGYLVWVGIVLIAEIS